MNSYEMERRADLERQLAENEARKTANPDDIEAIVNCRILKSMIAAIDYAQENSLLREPTKTDQIIGGSA